METRMRRWRRFTLRNLARVDSDAAMLEVEDDGDV